MIRSVRIALAQINPTVGDLKGNAGGIAALLGRAREHGAELVVFPELCLTGYPPEDLLFRGRFVDENLRALKDLMPRTRGLAAVIGFVDRDRQGRLYNAAAFLDNGRLAGVYRKIELPNYGVFDEKRYFTAGTRPCLVDWKGVRIGLTICEDIWLKRSFVFKKDFAEHASLLINISGSPYHRGKQRTRRAVVQALARRTRCPAVYLNLVGAQDELVFDGGSMIVDARGRILHESARFEPALDVFDLRIDGRRQPMARPRDLGAEEEVYRALKTGVGDYIRKNGFTKVLVGLSGGIDSALVARIAVDTLGPDNVIGVTMPSPYTSGATLADSKLLAKNLDIRCLEIPIGPVYRGMLDALSEAFAGRGLDIAEENLQARIRGNLLMALSNKFGWIVLTTGNKSELATGYCTLYGDMAGGFSVIKDVPKTLVYRLARWRNRQAPKGSIPPSILKRAPTAELKFNQTDQDTLPPYPVLDRALELYVERDLPVETMIRRGVPGPTARRVTAMVDRNEYKRRQASPGVKITPKAFGRDRRMPITQHFNR